MSEKINNNGWVLCNTDEDWNELKRLIEFNKVKEPPNLSQRETSYTCPPTKQTLVKLLRINQEDVGFYVVRMKGCQEEGGPPLQLPILDGAFICKTHRRKGWGIKMMEDITQHFPNQDIGLSQPISHSLELVVKTFLSRNAQHRDLLWSVENCGEEGDRLNLWLLLKRIQR